ncbi:PREDICTED: methylosome subunit pICln, partial [Fulmarus glacialis]|uniref:methylosome subunit pICln n=1 Tax=Fulmarus glacialis TaxID=30455 RepID=UPI00051C477A
TRASVRAASALNMYKVEFPCNLLSVDFCVRRVQVCQLLPNVFRARHRAFTRVTCRRLSWLENSGVGFSLDYPTISLHAVSRDLNAYPWEHLYVMVNAKFEEEESKEAPMAEGEEEEDSDDDVEPIAEFRFVPSDKSALEAMFSAMCECQALHPDPDDEDSDNDYEGEEYDVEAHELEQGDIPTFYTYEEGLSHLTAEGQATLERLEGMLAQSVSSQYNMAGVRTEDSIREFEDGMEVDIAPVVAGQFEDAEVDH